ncbi:sigma-70 family RNA polymerase sigma factor [Candidatus Woesearchaeota archaeon]|nr:sigma-70 family RNA polymerase sigma factor [Candidatus Woesearchaeota archaeon]
MEDYTALEHKLRTYTHSTDNKILTREEEREIFEYLRGLQKEMLGEVVSFDGTILREALGRYARVEEYFSREQIGDWDYWNKNVGSVRKPLYQQYLKKEKRLKGKETLRAQHKFVEWYRQNLSRECFAEICSLYLVGLEKAPNFNGEKKEKQERFRRSASKVDEVYSTILLFNQGLVKATYHELFPMVRICLSDGIAEEEVLQGGNMGLVTAIDKFDHLRGNKFSTYARWWVLSGIKRVLLNSFESFKALSNYYRNHREGEEKQLSPEQLEEFRALNAFLHTVSLNAPVKKGEDPNRTLEDVLKDQNSLSAEELTFTAELPRFMEEVLSKAVSPTEKDVLNRIYGLGGGEEQTGVDVSESYNCSGSRIRQIHAKAIKKLRRYFQKKELCDMLSCK